GSFNIYQYTFTPEINKQVVSITLPDDGADNRTQIISLTTTTDSTSIAPGPDHIATAVHGNEVYATDAKYQYVTASVINGGSTTLQNQRVLYGLDAASQIAVSSDGQWVYVTVPSTDQVAVY